MPNLGIGTSGSAIIELTASAIARLIEDLEALEGEGFKEPVCQMIKNAIEALQRARLHNPDAIYLNRIANDWDDLYRAYSEWNTKGEDTDPDAIIWRRNCIAELRQIRKRMKRVRTRSIDEITEGDARLATEMYTYLKVLSDKEPTRFKRLSTSVSKYQKAFGALPPPPSVLRPNLSV
jgi:hypothetical protein